MNDIIESPMNIETQVVVIFTHALSYVPIMLCSCSPKQAPLSWGTVMWLQNNEKKKKKIQDVTYGRALLS